MLLGATITALGFARGPSGPPDRGWPDFCQNRPPASHPPLPPRSVDVDAEISVVLAELAPSATRRFVVLEKAVQPELVASADVAEFRACLRDLVANAVNRAARRVLVAAMRQAEAVELTILDDGANAIGEIDTGRMTMPADSRVEAEHHPGCGTTVHLHIGHSAPPPPVMAGL